MFISGFDKFQSVEDDWIISSGNKFLDSLLSGGFRHDLVYLIYGDKREITNILLKTTINLFEKFGVENKVAFVDSINRFNPYNLSKLAISKNLSPTKILKATLISRAFTWEQMVELLEHRISRLENIRAVMITGITNLFPDYEKLSFESLLKGLNGIKQMLSKTNPLIILTSKLNKFSNFRPEGGKILSHFGHVLVLISDMERNVEYSLIQHPFLPESIVIRRKPVRPKRGLRIPSKNMKIDSWL